MEYFEITKKSEELHVEGFPNAVKVLRLDGPKPKRLSDLVLHKTDLGFSLECLEQINKVPEDPNILRQALWRSAVVHYMKCFGDNESRFSLVVKKVYKGDEGVMEIYKYFNSLRNKHFVHDENSYAQCLPGAVLNKQKMNHKIAKIVCLGVIGETLVQGNYNNLHLLITKAQQWVDAQFDDLCDILTKELEAEKYETHLAYEGIKYTVPEVEEIHKSRDAL